MALLPQNNNNPELYKVDFSELHKDNEFNRRLKESLANISNNVLDEDYLRKLPTDRRNVLYVLADASWTALCALQVYLEGPIDGMPSEDEGYGVAIHHSFRYFHAVPKDLSGARIVHLFAQEGDNSSLSVNLLTRFYNGEVIDYLRQESSLVPVQKKWERLHYFGVVDGVDNLDIARSWEDLQFFVLLVGSLKISSDFEPVYSIVFIKTLEDYERLVVARNEQCAMSHLARIARKIFVSLLALLRDFPPTTALRVINDFATLAEDEAKVDKLWSKLDDARLVDFIAHPHKYELVMHLIQDVAKSYFLRQLPLELTEREAQVLLLMGLQNKVLQEASVQLDLDQSVVRVSLRDVFIKLMDYFNQEAEVVDPDSGKR